MGARITVEMAKVGLLKVGWGVEKVEGEKGAEGESCRRVHTVSPKGPVLIDFLSTRSKLKLYEKRNLG